MSTKIISAVLLCFLGFIITGCSKGTEPVEGPAPAPAPGPVTSHSTPQPSSAAGIEWSVPASWTLQPERPMRLATYSIPAAEGDAEGAECAVFFFGSGQGGDVRSNIERWMGQFKVEGNPEESSRAVHDIQVTTVKIEGTYLAPGGPMMQSQGEKPGFRLHGTIVEAPDGPVFFKTTGPRATVVAAEKDITALVDSVRKSGGR